MPEFSLVMNETAVFYTLSFSYTLEELLGTDMNNFRFINPF